MTTDELQELAWDAEDSGKDIYTNRHESQDDVIVSVEVDGETYYNDVLDQELQPYDWQQDGGWRE